MNVLLLAFASWLAGWPASDTRGNESSLGGLVLLQVVCWVCTRLLGVVAVHALPEIFRTRGRGYTAELSCGLGRVWRERRTKVRDQNHGESIQMHVGGKQTGTALVCVCVCVVMPHHFFYFFSGAESLLACSLAFRWSCRCMQTAGPCSRNENG